MDALTITAGGLSGGVSSAITGGKFWQGATQGAIAAGLNHAMHSAMGNGPGDNGPGPKKQQVQKKTVRGPGPRKDNELIKIELSDGFLDLLGRAGEVVGLKEGIAKSTEMSRMNLIKDTEAWLKAKGHLGGTKYIFVSKSEYLAATKQIGTFATRLGYVGDAITAVEITYKFFNNTLDTSDIIGGLGGILASSACGISAPACLLGLGGYSILRLQYGSKFDSWIDKNYGFR